MKTLIFVTVTKLKTNTKNTPNQSATERQTLSRIPLENTM